MDVDRKTMAQCSPNRPRGKQEVAVDEQGSGDLATGLTSRIKAMADCAVLPSEMESGQAAILGGQECQTHGLVWPGGVETWALFMPSTLGAIAITSGDRANTSSALSFCHFCLAIKPGDAAETTIWSAMLPD